MTKPCRACGAPIVFVPTPTGHSVPLDATPEKRFVIGEDNIARQVDTYISHFATCPEAARFRKPKKQEESHA